MNLIPPTDLEKIVSLPMDRTDAVKPAAARGDADKQGQLI